MRWWGWGEEGREVVLSEAALSLLRDHLGVDAGARAGPVRSRTYAFPIRA